MISRNKTKTVQVNGSNSPAYTVGDVVGGVLIFDDVLSNFKEGVLQSINLLSKSVQTAGFKLYLFSDNPSNSTWTDNSAAAINVADLPKLLGVYSLVNYDSGLGTMTVYTLDGINKVIQNTVNSNLYGILVTTGTPTLNSTTDLTVTIGVIQ